MLAKKMKSCLDVTIVVGITRIARDLMNRNPISRPKIKVFCHEVGGGGFDCGGGGFRV